LKLKLTKRLLDLPRHMTWDLRHRLAAELHALLTMPEYRYLQAGEEICADDEGRLCRQECWYRILPGHPLIGLRLHAAGYDFGNFRRYRSIYES